MGLPNVLHITMWMRWLWLGCIGECGPLPSKLGCNTTLRPSAVGWYCTPISQEFGPHSPMHPRQSQRILSVHRGAIYQVFVRVSTASSIEPVSGKIDIPLGHCWWDSGKNWRKLELFSFKIKIFISKMTKNWQLSLVFQFFTQPCVLWHKNTIKPKRIM